MREIHYFKELAPANNRCVIINCSTKWVTSLALLSALRHAKCPVLLINCESTDGSRAHFERLARSNAVEFDWLEWPLRPHPDALDRLFDEIVDERVLLCDSDLELRSSAVVPAMQSALEASSQAYGAGFLHGPEWLGEAHGSEPFTGYYAERMWIPLVLLRTSVVRAARKRGLSFSGARRSGEFSRAPAPLRWLSRRRWMRWSDGSPARRRQPIPGLPAHLALPNAPYPRFVDFDTGALLHAELQAMGHPFAPVDPALWGEVTHYHGVTRATVATGNRKLLQAMGLLSTKNESSQQAISAVVMQRLRNEYRVGDDTALGDSR